MLYPEKVIGKQVQTSAKNIAVTLLSLVMFVIAVAALGVVTAVSAAFATSIAATTVVTGFTQPDTPRNITATLTGVAADVAVVGIVITGTDIAGEVLTETLPVTTLNTLGTVSGLLAFASITSVLVPAMDGAGVTVSIGVGDLIGLPIYLGAETLYATYIDGVKEGTAPTLVKSATVLAANTADLNSALDGSGLDFYLFV